ncbi:MAG: O-succinylbenzoic acid (OSB) synthetase [Ignavibacteria bacterium]|nr:MAG: O-succinylbenzoic acid (OSB) synthetase [Ignavibacteria bacterium]KAF0160833.1 MAG: O-succinylbenzoic acid (OSB) synthetase [Ignavibacteria bacterium]
MKIKEAKYFPFSLKLKIPFVNSTGILTERKGFVLKLTDVFGNIGYGECSPLPGFSTETLRDAEQSLNKIISFLLSSKQEDDYNVPSDFSSVTFAAEQALLNLALAQNKTLWLEKLGVEDKVIPVNAVIGFDDYQNIFDKIKCKIELGYTTFKIKVGRDNPYEDFELLETIRTNFGFDIKLRLDVNQKWTSDEAIEYLDRFRAFEIEYVEEPCEFACSTFRTGEETQIPIALDDSLKSYFDLVNFIADSNIEYFVVKPMIVGGISATKRIIKLAEQNNRKIIISSAFESAIGKQALVMLASLTNHSLAHGLDTSECFINDICTDVYSVKKGSVEFISSVIPHKTDLRIQ